jgi:hypothetical protein
MSILRVCLAKFSKVLFSASLHSKCTRPLTFSELNVWQVCAYNSEVATKLPSFWARATESRQAAAQKSKKGILGRIGGMISDGYDATKVTVDFLKIVCAALQKDKGMPLSIGLVFLLIGSICRSLLTLVRTDKGSLHWPERQPYFNFPPLLDFTSPAHNVRLHQGLWSLQVPYTYVFSL